MKIRWPMIIAGCLIVAATCAPVITTRTGATIITGSSITKASWAGLPFITRRQESPLGLWCREHHVPVTENTVFFSRIIRNARGFVLERGCGKPPASYDFTPATKAVWLARTPESDVRRFIDTMTATDETGRAHAIEAVCAQMLASQ